MEIAIEPMQTKKRTRQRPRATSLRGVKILLAAEFEDSEGAAECSTDGMAAEKS